MAGTFPSIPAGQWIEGNATNSGKPTSMFGDGVLPSQPGGGQIPPTGGSGEMDVVRGFSGGFYDSLRDATIIHGGGHSSYSGNEWYTFAHATQTWTRSVNPTSSIIPFAGSGSLAITGSTLTFSAAQTFTTGDYVYSPGFQMFQIQTGGGPATSFTATASGTAEVASVWARTAQTATHYTGTLPQFEVGAILPTSALHTARMSVHTVNNLVHVRGADLYWEKGGARATGGGATDESMWTLTPSTGARTFILPDDGLPRHKMGTGGGGATYNFADGKVYFVTQRSLCSWTPGTSVITDEAPDFALNSSEHGNGVVLDQHRQWVILFGEQGNGLSGLGAGYFDLLTRAGGLCAFTPFQIDTTTNAYWNILRAYTTNHLQDDDTGCFGWDYDFVTRQIVCWGTNGRIFGTTFWSGTFNDLIILTVDESTAPPTLRFTRETLTGGGDLNATLYNDINALKQAGVYNRFQYLHRHNCFAVVNSINMNVWYARRADQSLAVAAPNNAWVQTPNYAFGVGPHGGPGNIDNGKHGRWAVDHRRKLVVNAGGDVHDLVGQTAGGFQDFSNEVWRGEFGTNTWTQLQLASMPPSAGVVPGRPDNVPFAANEDEDELALWPGFFGQSQGNPITTTTMAITTGSPAAGQTLTLANTTGTGWTATGSLQLYPSGGLGGSQEVLSYTGLVVGTPGSVVVASRGASGTTAKAFASGVQAVYIGSNGYAFISPAGPIGEYGGYRMDAVTGLWSRAPWAPPPTLGYGGDNNSTFMTYDHGLRSYLSLYYEGGWGNNLLRLDRTSNTWTRYTLGGPAPFANDFRDAITNRSQLAIDARGRMAYFIAYTGNTFDVHPAIGKINLKAGLPGGGGFTSATLATAMPGYVTPTGGEAWIFFDDLNRVLLIPNNPNQFGAPTTAFFLYHVDTGVWETGPIPASMFYGNQGVFDPYRNLLLWRDKSGGGGVNPPYNTYRYYGGPTVAGPASNAPTITTLSPASALFGSGGFTLTVSGSNFTADAVVQWDGAPRSTIFDSATQLRATIPAADLTTVGTVRVTVTQTLGLSMPRDFTVLYPPTTLGIVFEGQIRDRIGQGDGALGPDGALDGTLALRCFGAGGRVITAIKMTPNLLDEWNTTLGDGKWLLGVASTRDGPLLNNPTTMAVGFAVADGETFYVFGSDASTPTFFGLGTTLTVTVTLADGSTATNAVTIGSGGTAYVRAAGPETLALTDGPLTRVVLPATSKPIVDIDLTAPPGLHATIRRIS